MGFPAQFIGTMMGVAWAALSGLLVYGLLKSTMGLHPSQDEACEGADLTIRRTGAKPDREVNW